MYKKLIGVGVVLLLVVSFLSLTNTATAQTGTTTPVCPVGFVCTSPNVQTDLVSSTISLSGDGAESSGILTAVIKIKVSALQSDAYIYKSPTNIVFIEDPSTGRSYALPLVTSVMTSSGGTSASDSNGTGMWRINAGQAVTLTITGAVDTSKLFAGFYRGRVQALLVNSSTNADSAYKIVLGDEYVTPQKAITGETSPYITSISSPVSPNGTVTIQGQRMDVTTLVYLDGQPVSNVSGKDSGTIISFPLPASTTPGYHTVYVENGKGRSNALSFMVNSFDATVTFPTTPTLSLVYNLLGKESQLRGLFDIIVDGGQLGVRVTTSYGASALLYSETGQQVSSPGTIAVVSGGKTGITPDGNKYVDIAPGTKARLRVVTSSNPQQMFAGTYRASLQTILVAPYGSATISTNKLEIPKNTTNAKTIVGELSPYIESVVPSSAIVPGTNVKVYGKRFISARVKIDGVLQTGVNLLVNDTGTALRFTMPKTITNGGHTLSLTKTTGESNSVWITVGSSTTPTTPLSTYWREIHQDGSVGDVINLSLFDSNGKEVALDTFNFPKVAPGTYSARYRTVRSGVETTITANVDVTSTSYRIYNIKDSNGVWTDEYTLSIEGKYVKIVEARAGVASGTYLVELNAGSMNIPPLTEAGIGPYLNTNPGKYIMSIWERRDGQLNTEGSVSVTVNEDRRGFDIREIAPVVCPVGYICTPGTSTEPQPVNCPVGYTCTVVTTPTTCINLTVDLQLGSTGPDVIALQTWLISQGFDIPDISSGSAAKGYFGQSTKEAVVKYQTSVGMPATGYVGPLTRAAINSTPCTKPASGIKVDLVSVSQTITDSSDSHPDSVSTFVIKFKATAMGDNDIYVGATSGSAIGVPVQWSTIGSAFRGVSSSILTSTASKTSDGKAFLIQEGTSQTFTLTVVLNNDAGVTGFYGVKVDKISYGTSAINYLSSSITSLEDLEAPQVPLNGYGPVVSNTLKVSSPNGGETYLTGNELAIKWSTGVTPYDTARIELQYQHTDPTYAAGTTFLDSIAVKVPNTGSYTWKIPEYYATGVIANSFKVKVSVGDQSDYSDSTFSVKRGTLNTGITVYKPVSGLYVVKGQPTTVSWSASSGSPYSISLLRKNDPGFLRLSLNTTYVSNGVQTWKVPTDLKDSNDYYLKINEGPGRDRTGYSGTFTISSVTPSPTPTISPSVSPTPSVSPVLGPTAEFVSSSVTVSDSSVSSNDDIGTFYLKFKVTAIGGDVYISRDKATSIAYTLVGPTTYGYVANLTSTASLDGSGKNYLINEGTSATFTYAAVVSNKSSATYAGIKLTKLTYGASAAAPATNSITLSNIQTEKVYLGGYVAPVYTTPTPTPTYSSTPTPTPTYSPTATPEPSYSSEPTPEPSSSPVTLISKQNASLWDAFMSYFGY